MCCAAHAELMATDPEYQQKLEQQGIDQEQGMRKSLEEQGEALALRNAPCSGQSRCRGVRFQTSRPSRLG